MVLTNTHTLLSSDIQLQEAGSLLAAMSRAVLASRIRLSGVMGDIIFVFFKELMLWQLSNLPGEDV